MKRFLLSFLVLAPGLAAAQSVSAPPQVIVVYTDTLSNHTVEGGQPFANDTLRYRYNQLRYYVKTVMPYVTTATSLFNEINARLAQPGLSKAERRRYLSGKERDMRDRFENQLRTLNVTQGVLLIKLIARQTGLNLYTILQQTKGDIAAMKYQAWARLHGVSLSKKYNPADEPDLERVMRQLGYD